MTLKFADLGVLTELVNVLSKNGITDPTPVQKEAIPLALEGDDVIAQAQTGTGKTLAFALPMLQRIRTENAVTQGLILTPTRELAIQITTELNKLAPVMGVRVLAAYGGQDVEKQLHKLKGNIHLVVATPGRLLDHMRRGSIDLSQVKMLVLDEADQMLHMGFLKEVEEIIMATNYRRQTMLFSATMPNAIRGLAMQYMREAKEIRIAPKQVTLKEIEQIVIETSDRAKEDTLCQMLIDMKPYLAVVFCRTKRRAAALNEALQERGFSSDELHGDLSQAKREGVMKRFREARIHILIATDVAARGIDVEGITHVFNYDITPDAESYIHRIGRTGRAGEHGTAITFATGRDAQNLETIERALGHSLKRQRGQFTSTSKKESADEVSYTTSQGRNAGKSRGDRGNSRTTGNDRGGRDGGRKTRGDYQRNVLKRDNKRSGGQDRENAVPQGPWRRSSESEAERIVERVERSAERAARNSADRVATRSVRAEREGSAERSNARGGAQGNRGGRSNNNNNSTKRWEGRDNDTRSADRGGRDQADRGASRGEFGGRGDAGQRDGRGSARASFGGGRNAGAGRGESSGRGNAGAGRGESSGRGNAGAGRGDAGQRGGRNNSERGAESEWFSGRGDAQQREGRGSARPNFGGGRANSGGRKPGGRKR
ncbi:DEAD/DEAH box helicase [Paenibacillus radicibacter]|uniref:DEAD/DEAH box helicase n=1 Tax=Paenibacillus radicibacter TaxID=2972488 RepID=UPI00280ADE86|nr:DEAD/DEAH box helicase [Paenibacillus radicibacter]